jgi:hypothetical protein
VGTIIRTVNDRCFTHRLERPYGKFGEVLGMSSVALTGNPEPIGGGASGMNLTMCSYRCEGLESNGWHTVAEGTQLQSISRELDMER